MTENQRTIQTYRQGFMTSDHENILSYLTDDVCWEIPGNNIVVAEDAVQNKMKNGGLLDAVFCDVIHMNNGKIKHLTSY